MIVSWAIENNLVYFLGVFWLGSTILIVSWSHRWNAVNYLVYFRKDLIVTNSYLVGILWYLFIKTNFTRITNNRVSNLHIVHLVRCNSVLYFK